MRSRATRVGLVVALLLSAGLGVAEAAAQSDRVQALVEGLEAPRPEDRARAADALGRQPESERDRISPALRARLRGDDDWRVRAASGRALGRLGARDAVPDLVRGLRDPVVDVRVVSAAALWRLPDPAAVPALVECLSDDDRNARQWAALALGVARDRRATGPLMGLLDDSEQDVRLDVIRSLGRIRDPQATRALEAIAASGERDLEERLEAVGALASLDGPEKSDALVRLLRQDERRVRTRVVAALGQVGDALVVASLRRHRADESASSVRVAIDEAIRSIEARARGEGTNAPLALPPMP